MNIGVGSLRRGSAGWVGRAILALAFAGVMPALMADDASTPAGARAVRLSSVDGKVTVSQGDQVLADSALINTPLFEGTQVKTGDDGRAEIQFDEGSVARISPNSSLTLTVLRPNDGASGTEVRLDGGLGYFELQSGGDASHMQVRFGDSVVTTSGFTVLRVDMDNAPGELAVFSGNAHLERGGALSLDLHGGESVSLNASNPSQYDLAESIEPDSWDTWNSDRDQALTSESTSRTTATNSLPNSNNPAWSDLDANGNWYDVPGQGYVWSPYDASNPGWDPYGNGNWMWNPGFGYMWISGDSWGYMPFNCGMWSFYGGFGWGWSPGVGGCSPWWGGGVFITNIGYAPFGYLPPRMPVRPPRMPGAPGRRKGPYPLIAVNKRPASGFGGNAPHERNVSATIAGHVVMPMKPISPRPVYDRTVITGGSRFQPGAPGDRGPVFNGGTIIAPRPAGPGNAQGPGNFPNTPRPVNIAPRAPAPAPAPAPHMVAPAGGGGAPHGGGGGGGSPHH